MDDLALDETGLCTLGFDEQIVNIHFDERSSNLVLFAALGSLPVEGRERALALLMEANLFWSGTGGATLALEPGANVVMLHHQVRADMEQADFEALLQQFVDLSDYWSGKLADGGGAAPTTGEADGPVAPGMRV
jgi:hypothetical protein